MQRRYRAARQTKKDVDTLATHEVIDHVIRCAWERDRLHSHGRRFSGSGARAIRFERRAPRDSRRHRLGWQFRGSGFSSKKRVSRIASLASTSNTRASALRTGPIA